MPTAHVFIATSLDGYIARMDGGIDWLPMETDPGEDYGYDAFMGQVDGLVMGRGSFEKVLEFPEWPYPKPVIVMSRTMTTTDIRHDLHDKVEVSALSPRDLLSALDMRGWQRIYLDGGKLIQSFLREGLVEDLVITRIPVLIGEGRALFGHLEGDLKLKHIETRSYPSGLVQSRYGVLR